MSEKQHTLDEREKEVGDLYEKNRPDFHHWGTLKMMCVATAIQYADKYNADLLAKVEEQGKLIEKLHDDVVGIEKERKMWFDKSERQQEIVSEQQREIERLREQKITFEKDTLMKIAACFYGIGSVGWDMNPHIKWGQAWKQFLEDGTLPASDWKHRMFGGGQHNAMKVDLELSEQSQRIAKLEEALREALPLLKAILNYEETANKIESLLHDK